MLSILPVGGSRMTECSSTGDTGKQFYLHSPGIRRYYNVGEVEDFHTPN